MEKNCHLKKKNKVSLNFIHFNFEMLLTTKLNQ